MISVLAASIRLNVFCMSFVTVFMLVWFGINFCQLILLLISTIFLTVLNGFIETFLNMILRLGVLLGMLSLGLPCGSYGETVTFVFLKINGYLLRVRAVLL